MNFNTYAKLSGPRRIALTCMLGTMIFTSLTPDADAFFGRRRRCCACDQCVTSTTATATTATNAAAAKELAALEAKIADHEKTIKELGDKIASNDSKDAIAKLQKDLGDARKEIADVKKAAADQAKKDSETHLELQKDLAALREKADKMVAKLQKDLDDSRKEAADRGKKDGDANAELQKEIAGLKEKAASTLTKLEAAQAEIDKLKKDLAAKVAPPVVTPPVVTPPVVTPPVVTPPVKPSDKVSGDFIATLETLDRTLQKLITANEKRVTGDFIKTAQEAKELIIDSCGVCIHKVGDEDLVAADHDHNTEVAKIPGDLKKSLEMLTTLETRKDWIVRKDPTIADDKNPDVIEVTAEIRACKDLTKKVMDMAKSIFDGKFQPEKVTAALKIGDMAPSFTVKNTDGKETKLEDLRGQVVVISFNRGDKSEFCTRQLKHIAEFESKLAAEKAVYLPIFREKKQMTSADNPAPKLVEEIRESGFKGPLYLDLDAASTNKYPTNEKEQLYCTVIIDAKGKVSEILWGTFSLRPSGDAILKAIQEAKKG